MKQQAGEISLNLSRLLEAGCMLYGCLICSKRSSHPNLPSALQRKGVWCKGQRQNRCAGAWHCLPRLPTFCLRQQEPCVQKLPRPAFLLLAAALTALVHCAGIADDTAAFKKAIDAASRLAATMSQVGSGLSQAFAWTHSGGCIPPQQVPSRPVSTTMRTPPCHTARRPARVSLLVRRCLIPAWASRTAAAAA